MAIWDFLKKGGKKSRLNEQILKLSYDFQQEIRDFQHFKELQKKKIDILRKIKETWNEKWQEAESLVKNQIPALIQNQTRFVEKDVQYIDEEDYILQYLQKVEEGRTGILGQNIQNIDRKHLLAFRDLINKTLKENSIILKGRFQELYITKK